MELLAHRDPEEARKLLDKIRVGLNSGEVVVRAIAIDLQMDYSAIGQTAHLAGRMEQLADPGASAPSSLTCVCRFSGSAG